MQPPDHKVFWAHVDYPFAEELLVFRGNRGAQDLPESRKTFGFAWLSSLVLFTLLPTAAIATSTPPDLTRTGLGFIALAVFILAYIFVIAEEFTELRKSKPMVIAAGVAWLLTALAWQQSGVVGAADILRDNLLEYAELLLFLLAAMTYINTLQERNMFAVLRE